MKRWFLILMLAVMTLMCSSAAHADYFSANVPDNAYIYDACLIDGGRLAIMTSEALYQADTATGAVTLLAPMFTDSSGDLIVSPDGGIYTLSRDWEASQEHLYRLDEAASEWTEVAVITFDNLDVYEEEYPSIQETVFYGGKLFFTVYRDGKPSLLASYDMETGDIAGHGDFSAMPWRSQPIFATAEGVMTLDSDENDQLFRFTYDAAQGKIVRTPETMNVEGYAQDIRYDAGSGLYWVILSQGDGRALYSGTALDQLTLAAQPVSSYHAVPAGDDCILISSDWLMSYQIIKHAAAQITVSNLSSSGDTGFTVQTGITVASTYSEVADILNTRNSDIDIFAFWSERDPGLKIIKDKGYFVDLYASDVISAQAARLYPNLLDAISTEDGKLAAWIISLDCYLPYTEEWLLEEYGLEAPTTLPELMDQLNILIDEGVFSSGEYVPFGYVQYGQQSFIQFVLQRYIFEQEVQGLRLNFDNDELRALLERIVAELPRENQYCMETGEEMSVYELYVVPSEVHKDDMMPLKLSENSPLAIESSVLVAVVNPYSKHQEEAIRYLEYIAQRPQYDEYLRYADITEPVEYSWARQRITELEAEIAVLEAQEADTDTQDLLDALRGELANVEQRRYQMDAEDLAAWHVTESALVVQQETVYTDELRQLVNRLASGSLTVDAFINECNRYVEMVYAENNR